MGFSFRKRNPKGLNISLSSRGLRVSKSVRMGKLTANIGHYFGGTHSGKTTTKGTANLGNGLRYEKNKTVDLNPTLTKHFENSVDGNTYSDSPLWVRLFASPLGALVIPVLCYFWIVYVIGPTTNLLEGMVSDNWIMGIGLLVYNAIAAFFVMLAEEYGAEWSWAGWPVMVFSLYVGFTIFVFWGLVS